MEAPNVRLRVAGCSFPSQNEFFPLIFTDLKGIVICIIMGWDPGL